MLSAKPLSSRISATAFVLAMIATFGLQMRAQDVPAVHVGGTTITGIPDDWTHHHVTFSDPGTEQDAVMNGTHEQWLKTVNDPRYVVQQLKRGGPVQGPAAQDVETRRRVDAQLSGTADSSAQGTATADRWKGPRKIGDGPRGIGPTATPNVSMTPLVRDWSMNVGGTLATMTLNIATPTSSNINNSGPNTSKLTIEGVSLIASPPAAASASGTFTGNPTAAQNLTIGGTEILTPSLSTAGTQTGTFSSSPLSSSVISVVYNGNTLNLTTNGTGSKAIGTAAGVPAANTTISVTSGANTVTLSNGGTGKSVTGTVAGVGMVTKAISVTSGANTVSLTPGGTGATIIGTAGGTTPAANTQVTLTSGSNTLTLTNGGSVGFYSLNFSGNSNSNGSITITYSGGASANALVMSPGASNGCTTSLLGTFVNATSATTRATNFDLAIASCLASFPAIGVSSARTGTTDKISEALPGNFLAVTNSLTSTTGSSLTTGNNGSNACGGGSSTAGTYATSNIAATLASNISAAINACNTGNAAVGATSSYTATNTFFTVTDAIPGSFPTFSGGVANAAGIFSWGSVTPGTDGTTNTCSGAAPTFTGTYVNSSNTTTVAGNINTAIGVCAAAVGVTTATATNTVTVTDTTPGTFTTFSAAGNTTGIFTWAGVTAGTNGSNTCTGAAPTWTGTYATSNVNNTLAGNINTAIGVCAAAVGVSTSVTTNAVTVTDTTPGSFTTFSVGGTNNTGIFNWGGVVTGGNGSNTCPSSTTGTFATDASPTNLAGNLALAILACPVATGLNGALTTSSAASVTVTANKWGANPGITLGSNGGFFTWTGTTFTNGADGLNTGANFAIDNVVADNATNLASAITRNGGTVGVTGASSTGTVTITATAQGTGGNGITVANTLANFSLADGNLSGGTYGLADTTHFPYTDAGGYVSSSQLAANIAAAANSNGTIGGLITTTAGAGTVTLTSMADGASGDYSVATTTFPAVTAVAPGTLPGNLVGGAAGGQPGQFPAKYSFALSTTITTANCTSDFVIYPTAGVGSATQATIIAYNNIYKTTCTPLGSVPSIYWAYNTGGTATLSPVLSFDGSEVAYIQNTGTGTTASLVLLKMPAVGTPWTGTVQTLTGVAASAYHNCTAPCFTAISLGAADTNSAPFYDYLTDNLYVGDDSGNLHKIQSVFNGGVSAGVPGEAASWPVSITATAGLKVLGSPVYDLATGNVFVGEGYSGTGNPVLTQVNATTRVKAPSVKATNSPGGLGIAPLEAPVVDSSAARVYAFTGDDGSGGLLFNTNGCGTTGLLGSYPCAAAFQMPTGSTFGTATPVQAKLGAGVANRTLYAGDFNNTYYNSTNPASPTGALLVCGYDIASSGIPTLYSVAITGNVVGTVTTGPALTSAASTCSPVSEIDNGGTDWIFVSVTGNGNKNGCSGSCVYSFSVGGGITSSTNSTAGSSANGGATGIIIDNLAPFAGGGSQVYYTTLSSQACSGNGTTGSGTGGCAIQASQAALN